MAGISGADQEFSLSISGSLRVVGPGSCLPPGKHSKKEEEVGELLVSDGLGLDTGTSHFYILLIRYVISLLRFMQRKHRPHLSKGVRLKKF